MSLAPVRKPRAHTGSGAVDQSINAVAEALEDAVRPIQALAILDGVHLTEVSIATSSTLVPHKLGRTPVGWIVTDTDSVGVVRRISWDASNLELIASAATVANLWVF